MSRHDPKSQRAIWFDDGAEWALTEEGDWEMQERKAA